MKQVSIRIFHYIFGKYLVFLRVNIFWSLISFVFSLEIREPLNTNNSYRAGGDSLRRLLRAIKLRMQKFKEQQRKDWQEVNDWLKRHQSGGRPTDLFIGRRRKKAKKAAKV